MNYYKTQMYEKRNHTNENIFLWYVPTPAEMFCVSNAFLYETILPNGRN